MSRLVSHRLRLCNAEEGRRWRFVRRELLLDGERLHELTASDVTAEYAKTEALQRDKEALSRLKAELNEYNLGIDDTVRKQEILRAKVNIHDEMNRLMLSTVAAEKATRRRWIGSSGSGSKTLSFCVWKRIVQTS